jgi:hypothetical protein
VRCRSTPKAALYREANEVRTREGYIGRRSCDTKKAGSIDPGLRGRGELDLKVQHSTLLDI